MRAPRISVWRYSYTCYMFFFFQAEDGIRDSSVTGVQTCALPISIWAGLAVNTWPGSTPGRVGPRPEANSVSTSLACAGAAAVTSEKSTEWTIAGPVAVEACSWVPPGKTIYHNPQSTAGKKYPVVVVFLLLT